MKLSGNITGGSLLTRESRIVAQLLLNGHDFSSAKQEIIDKNLFQNDSRATTLKYCSLITARLEKLPHGLLRIVAEGGGEVSRLALLAAVLRTTPIVADFMREVVSEKVRCFETHLAKTDWSTFLECKAPDASEGKTWTESSRRKIGQVVIRMLTEAGYLSDTREMRINKPHIPAELAKELAQSGEAAVLSIMRLEN